MTIYFPDVSHVGQAGLKLKPGTVAVLAKATEGSTFVDPSYHDFKDQAAKIGAVFGAYHFLWSGTPEEARFVFNVVGKTPLMLDVENTKVKTGVSTVLNFVREYRKLGGVVHLVYLPHWYWQGALGSPDLNPLIKEKLCLGASNYTTYSDQGPGWDAYGGETPIEWQYTDRMAYGGMKVDFDAFKGTVEQWSNILHFGQLTKPDAKPAVDPTTHRPVPPKPKHISMPNVAKAEQLLGRASKAHPGHLGDKIRNALKALRGKK